MCNKSEKYFPIIEQYYKSNQSVRVFSEQNGINRSTIEYWKKRYKSRDERKTGFAVISVVEEMTKDITIQYTDGTRLMFSGSSGSSVIKQFIPIFQK